MTSMHVMAISNMIMPGSRGFHDEDGFAVANAFYLVGKILERSLLMNKTNLADYA